WSPDRRRLLVHARGRSGVGVAMHNLETGKSGLYLEGKSSGLACFRWSYDSRWLVFSAFQDVRSRVYVAPFADEGPAANTWVPITDGSTREDKTDWSPDGDLIYSISDRDGFLCIWAYRLDPQTKKPAGEPTAFFHSHSARLSLRNASPASQ